MTRRNGLVPLFYFRFGGDGDWTIPNTLLNSSSEFTLVLEEVEVKLYEDLSLSQ